MEGVWTFFDDRVKWLVDNEAWEWVFSGIGVAIIGALWALFRWFIARRRADESPAPLRSDLAQRNRQRMLEKVQHMWVEGWLEQSLYQVARIELGFSEALEAIEHPWELVAQHPERVPTELPDGVRMLQVFDQFDKTLLLLGAPGSGKTTLLLELARDLIERAKEDPAHPIPVVFNLSSWAFKRPPLEAWLVDELNQRYDVPRKVGQAWVEESQVLPLLDGLDEVALEHREACVEAINAFRGAHGLLPLVVCSRSADYAALSVQLRLLGAVAIQPLSRTQCEQYIQRAGAALSGVSAAVRGDHTLWELLDTPLMLSILALAYQGRVVSEVNIAKLKGGLDERRAALFSVYIKAMFARRTMALPCTPQQTRHWLSWLARAMVRHDQTVFYLEGMQPYWLPKKQEHLQGVISGLGVGLLFGLLLWLVFGLGVGLLFGLLFGLGVGVNQNIEPVEALQWSWREPVRVLGVGLVGMLLFWLVFGLAGGLLFWLVFGLTFGLTVGLNPADEIPTRTIPNEGIRRSLKNALSVGLVGVLVGVLVGGLLFGLVGGLLFGLVGGLFFGLLNGGRACIQHGVLRVLLWRYDYAPLNYVRFLEHAKNQLFLRRVGGGYIFVHRMLMEHFSGLEEQGLEVNSVAEVSRKAGD